MAKRQVDVVIEQYIRVMTQANIKWREYDRLSVSDLPKTRQRREELYQLDTQRSMWVQGFLTGFLLELAALVEQQNPTPEGKQLADYVRGWQPNVPLD